MKTTLEIEAAVMTILQEAGAEPRSGKLGVAYVILVNRPMAFNRSILDTIFKPWHFSCWNTDSPTRMNLDTFSDAEIAEAYRCALAAYYALEPDPTKGACFYLNKDAVIAAAGKLPDWWDTDTLASSEITIGRHTFRKKLGQ